MVYELGYLGKTMKQLLELLSEFEKRCIILGSVENDIQIVDYDHSKFYKNLKILEQLETQLKRKKVKRAMKKAKEEGTVIGRQNDNAYSLPSE